MFSRRSAWTAKMAFSRSEHVDDEWRMRISRLSGIFTSGRRPQGFSSTLLKVPIERVQIDAIKFKRTQIHFFTNVFTAVVVFLA